MSCSFFATTFSRFCCKGNIFLEFSPLLMYYMACTILFNLTISFPYKIKNKTSLKHDTVFISWTVIICRHCTFCSALISVPYAPFLKLVWLVKFATFTFQLISVIVLLRMSKGAEIWFSDSFPVHRGRLFLTMIHRECVVKISLDTVTAETKVKCLRNMT